MDREKNIIDLLENTEAKELVFEGKEQVKSSILAYIMQQSGVVKPLYKNVALMAASILLLVALGLGIAYKASEVTLSAGLESNAVTLYSNVQIVLEPNASVTYNSFTWRFNRELTLRGVASFDVSKGKFKVLTQAGEIQVLGTQFKVAEAENALEVFCYEGSVQVKTQAGENVLHKDEYLIFNGDTNAVGTIELPEVITYDNVPLEQVLQQLKTIFGLTIEMQGDYADIFYSGAIFTKELAMSLEMLFGSCNIKYTLNGTHLTLY